MGVFALVGCGYRSFSMSTARIGAIKDLLRRLDSGAVGQCIQDLATRGDADVPSEITTLARRFEITLE